MNTKVNLAIKIYLLNNGSVLSYQAIPIYVNQIGISAKISNFAKNQEILYGLFSVLIALFIGFITNYFFVYYVNYQNQNKTNVRQFQNLLYLSY